MQGSIVNGNNKHEQTLTQPIEDDARHTEIVQQLDQDLNCNRDSHSRNRCSQSFRPEIGKLMLAQVARCSTVDDRSQDEEVHIQLVSVVVVDSELLVSAHPEKTDLGYKASSETC